jgi:hypothetical protein
VEVAASEPADAFDANDEAMLDMVAMEMAAPDSDAAYDPMEDTESDETQVNEAQLHGAQVHADQIDTPKAGQSQGSAASWEIDVTFGSETDGGTERAVASAPPAVTPLQPVPKSELEPTPSLGSSLLANGIVSRPRSSRSDPLAPIRRMSQNEKIAFFS